MQKIVERRLPGFAAVMLIAAACFSSCTTPETPPRRGLTLTEDKTVAFDETPVLLRITARTDWTLSVAEGGWIHPRITGGAAEDKATDVYFDLDKNTTGKQRTGSVAIEARGEAEPYIFTVTQNPENLLTGINKWMYDELCSWYYWNDAMKAVVPPAGPLDYTTFFSSLITRARDSGAEDDTEDPPTIDGGYSDGTQYIYSYVKRTPAGTRAESDPLTFGFNIVGIRGAAEGSPDTYPLLVTWVQPDSPADKAGLKRGTWIYRYNGKAIYQADFNDFWDLLHSGQSGSLNFTGKDGTPYRIEAEAMAADPIIFHDVITTGKGHKVAYLVYNSFEPGDGDVFDRELRTIFKQFKDGGADRLVLDLRYNHGGSVASSQLLSSLAGNVNSKQIFAKLLFNDDIAAAKRWANPRLMYFSDESVGMKQDKIYVLVTEESASASELVINSLRGVLGDGAVVLIGTQTEGKNVGMTSIPESGKGMTTGGYTYEMWPITFKSSNAKDFCDYAGGFAPDYRKDELYDILHDRGAVLYSLGDRNERLLKAALEHIDTGTTAADPATRAGERTAVRLQSPRPGGMKYIPPAQQ